MTATIERTLELHAHPVRVWRAISDADERGQWFGAQLERGRVDVEAVHAPARLAWRWGGSSDAPSDAGNGTLVEWTLTPRADGGTTLRIVESGFASEADRERDDDRWTDELRALFAYLDAEAARETGADDDEVDPSDDDSPLTGGPLTPATP